MNDLLSIAVYLLGIMQGIVFGYIFWAPTTAFKQGFIDGLLLKFLWGKK